MNESTSELNPYNLNPELTRAVIGLSESPSPSSRLQFYTSLRQGHIIIAVEDIPEELRKTGIADPSSTLAINIKTSLLEDGRRFLLGFTDLQAIQNRYSSHQPYIIVSTLTALEQACCYGLSGLLINPAGPSAILTARQAKRIIDQHNDRGETRSKEQDLESARQYRDVGDLKQAQEILERLVASYPAYFSAQYELAVTYAQLDCIDKALFQLETLLGATSDFEDAPLVYARLLMKVERFEEARDQLQAVNKDNNQEIRDALLAECYLELSQPKEAAKLLEQLLSESGSEKYYVQLGRALLESKNFEEAIVHYRTGIELYPDSAELHHGLAKALSLNGHITDAIHAVEEAIQLNSELLRSIFEDEEFEQLHDSHDFRRLASYFQ